MDGNDGLRDFREQFEIQTVLLLFPLFGGAVRQRSPEAFVLAFRPIDGGFLFEPVRLVFDCRLQKHLDATIRFLVENPSGEIVSIDGNERRSCGEIALHGHEFYQKGG